MELSEIIGAFVGTGCLLALLIGTLVLACKETKKRLQVCNVQVLLMDKMYRVLCAEYPDEEVK